jgi:bla regulator protein BlaR1
MKMFSAEFFSAVSWTLIHSLWQGLIISLIAGIMIITTKKSSSARRYKFLAFLFFIFIVAITVTFCFQLQHQAKAVTNPSIQTFRAGTEITIDRYAGMNTPVSHQFNFTRVWHSISAYVDEHTQLIVLCWFLFFVVNFVRLGSGLIYVHRLRYSQNYEVDDEWMIKLKKLANLSGITIPILFLESELVKVPVVVGMFRPLILVPVGLLMNLPVSQVEAILLHELAHIRRSDYLFNLIQTITTTVFFFNPAVLWLSYLLREEREACCDDIVVELTTDKTTYVEALVSFQEFTLGRNIQAMALGSHKNILLKRVSRMLTQENKKLNIMEKTALLAGVAGLMAFTFFQQPTEKVVIPTPVKIESKVHSVTAAKNVIASSKQVHPVTSTIAPVHVIAPKKVSPVILVIDTVPKKIAPVEIKENYFPSISSSINNDGKTTTSRIEATDQSGKKYRINKVNDKVTEMYIDDVAVPEKEIPNYEPLIEQIDAQRESNALASRKRLEEQRERTLAEKENRMIQRNARMEQDRAKRQQELLARHQKMEKERNERTVAREKQEKNIVESRQLRMKLAAVGTSNGEISSIINELTNANVISNTDNLSFSLNNESLTVNGKKQSSDLHKKLKDKYIQKPGDLYKYSKNGNSTSITINKD